MTISAKVLLRSKHMNGGPDITTLELKYPRFIHSEFMTHRMFSRNSSSSRAIPVDKMIDNVLMDPVFPIHWGKNQKGMQATEELNENSKNVATNLWANALLQTLGVARQLGQLGVHKQVVNRLIEPFAHMTVIVTATEWDNFLALRNHEAAQPEIRELASQIEKLLLDNSNRAGLDGKLHAPYSSDVAVEDEYQERVNFFGILIPKYILVSVGRCCRVSYLTHEGKRDPKDDMRLAVNLLENGHMSPFEHVAFCSHNVSGMFDNFKGWLSLRRLIPHYDNFKGYPEVIKKEGHIEKLKKGIEDRAIWKK